MTPEIREIPGYIGYYASSDGVIFSSWLRGGRYSKPHAKGPRPMSPVPVGAGYLSVTLGSGRKRYVHRLVALAFHGDPPSGFEACHNDGNKRNNRAENIRWASRQENMRDNISQGKVIRGSRSTASKLNEDRVAEIKQLLATREMSHSQIAARFGVSQATVGLIATNKTWRHVPNPEGFGQRRRGEVTHD